MNQSSTSFERGILIASFGILLAVGCQAEHFGGRSGAPKSAPTPTSVGASSKDAGKDESKAATTSPVVAVAVTSEREGSQEFDLGSSVGKLDMVWVIDNSGSMQEEIKQVSDNVPAFINQMQKTTDTNFVVLSSGSKGVQIPSDITSRADAFLDIYVDSHDALTLAAVASCPADGDGNINTTCGYKVPDMHWTTAFSSSLANYNAAEGKLVGKFRKDAKRVYVFVTDDDAERDISTEFVDVISPSGGAGAIVFAFVGLAGTSSCAAATGKAYKTLADKTGGKVFDICDKDWTTHFDQLLKSLNVIANSDYAFKDSNVKSIVEVKQGSKTIDAKDYSLANNKITISPKALDPNGGPIQVKYKYLQ